MIPESLRDCVVEGSNNVLKSGGLVSSDAGVLAGVLVRLGTFSGGESKVVRWMLSGEAGAGLSAGPVGSISALGAVFSRFSENRWLVFMACEEVNF